MGLVLAWSYEASEKNVQTMLFTETGCSISGLIILLIAVAVLSPSSFRSKSAAIAPPPQ
jgi:hypothetical protein